MKNKKLLTGMLATVLSVCMICSNVSIAQAQETNDAVIANNETGIPDTNLYNAILEVADKNVDGKLTIAEAEALDSLEIKNVEIKDLTGIGYCKNLTQFTASECKIKDISPLKDRLDDNVPQYESLMWLDLSNNQIEDISILADDADKDFYMLNLSNNRITDIEALADFSRLRSLDLSNNQIRDISALAETEIVYLDLSNNQIIDISAMNSIKGFVKIDLSNNQILDISPLYDKLNDEPGCSDLDLSNNQIADISALRNAEISYLLDLSNNQIMDITSFNDMQKNAEANGEYTPAMIRLANNKINDITALANFKELYTLDLSNNSIRDISILDALKESGCEIITDGNPIGEPEEPSEPETPSEPEKPTEPEQPIYNADDFAALIGTQDVVVKPNDYVTITFAQGSKLNDTAGKAEYDFTTTVTAEFANAKLPAFITENSFITKISYSYSGVLPASASIQIFVGEKYVGTEVFYFLLNTDNTFDKNEVQKVKVNENGYITVTQEHCSDYVVTTVNPVTLYEEIQTPDTDVDNSENNSEPEKDNNVNNSESETESPNEEAPKTGDNSPIFLLSMIIICASAMVLFGVKKYKNIF